MADKPTGDVAVIRSGHSSDDTAQTIGMPRLAGVSSETTGSDSIWLGRVTGEPGMDSGPHHHGEAETAGHILSGNTRIFYGKEYNEYVDLGSGDFIYIPPFLPHIERNLHESEPVEFVTARSPDNIVVNIEEDQEILPE